MLSFHRVFALITFLVSFALLSSARPAHHARGVAVAAPVTDASVFVARLKTFQADIGTCSDDLAKVAATGADPQVQVKKVVSTFDAMSAYLAKVSVKLTPEQEKECAAIISTSLITVTEASHKVAAKAKFMKWYSHWTELDVCLQGFLNAVTKAFSFSLTQGAIKTAGKEICSELHDMKMRLMVNMFRGMGIGY